MCYGWRDVEDIEEESKNESVSERINLPDYISSLGLAQGVKGPRSVCRGWRGVVMLQWLKRCLMQALVRTK